MDPARAARLSPISQAIQDEENTKQKQQQILAAFWEHVIKCKDSARACYGPKHIEVAHEQSAIQTLLITDDLFRSSDIKVWQKYVKLVDSVRACGGAVYIFSSLHVTGEQLAQITGIAAILRFPMPDLDDIEM